MFERFTDEARAMVVVAQGEARALGHGWIGTEHLLLAALRPSSVAGTLESVGLTHARVVAVVRGSQPDPSDDAVLRELGIDVAEVRRRVEADFGAGALETAVPEWRPPRRLRLLRARRRGGGHIPFTGPAKQALVLGLREAVRLSSSEITAEHLVLGTMAAPGRAAAVVTVLGVTSDEVRRAVLAQLGRAA